MTASKDDHLTTLILGRSLQEATLRLVLYVAVLSAIGATIALLAV